jgi:hypothetical protein
MHISLKACGSSTYSLRVGGLLYIFTYRCKNPPLPHLMIHIILNFMIRFTSCFKIMGEAHGWGTFTKMWGRIWLPLHHRPLILGMSPHSPPWGLPYITWVGQRARASIYLRSVESMKNNIFGNGLVKEAWILNLGVPTTN